MAGLAIIHHPGKKCLDPCVAAHGVSLELCFDVELMAFSPAALEEDRMFIGWLDSKAWTALLFKERPVYVSGLPDIFTCA